MDLISRIRSLGVARAVGVGAARADDPAARILLPADYVRDHVEHAYAITAYRAQGLTCDRTHLVGAEQMTREGLYVALTRARGGGTVQVVAAGPDEAAGRLRDALGRVGEHQAALDLLAGQLDARRDERHTRAARERPEALRAPEPQQENAQDQRDRRAVDPTREQLARALRDATPDTLRRAAEQARRLNEQRRADDHQRPQEQRRQEPPSRQTPRWWERPGGRSPARVLVISRSLAEREAAEARAAAAPAKARADELAAVLGTDASPGRRALAARRGHLQAAEAHLAAAGRHAAAQRAAEATRSAAYADYQQLTAEATRGRLTLRLHGTSRAEIGALAAERGRQAADWSAITAATAGRSAALHAAWRACQHAAGHEPRGFTPDHGQVAAELRRLHAQLHSPDATRRADQADQQAHQRLAEVADRAAAYAARPARRAAELGAEIQLRRDMPAADRAAEDHARADAERQAEREAARAPARRGTLDYDYDCEPSRDHGIER